MAKNDRAPYEASERRPETLGELEQWTHAAYVYYGHADRTLTHREPVGLHTPPDPYIDRLSAYCYEQYGGPFPLRGCAV